jgi:hypothetical protein
MLSIVHFSISMSFLSSFLWQSFLSRFPFPFFVHFFLFYRSLLHFFFPFFLSSFLSFLSFHFFPPFFISSFSVVHFSISFSFLSSFIPSQAFVSRFLSFLSSFLPFLSFISPFLFPFLSSISLPFYRLDLSRRFR